MKRSFLQPKWKNTGLLHFRFKKVEPYIKGKKVLDIGCAVGFGKPNWMHSMIAEKAVSVKGIDIDKSAVEKIQAKGYDVALADAQDFQLDEKFDVIHAGELIEHLDNFHGFLQSCKRHLAAGGILLITTPNAMRFGNFVYSYFGGLDVNNEHTCWFCEKTITSLLARNGYEIVMFDYLEHGTRSKLRKFVGNAIRALLPKRMAWNTIMVVTKVAQA